MKIFLVRHGETTGDVEDRYGGDYDDHLTEEGRRQSELAASQLKDRGIEALYVSSLVRAQETATIVAGTLGCSIATESDLRERNQYGELTGMIKSEAREKHPEWVELLKDKYNTIPGAESYDDFRKRIEAVWAKFAAQDTHAVVGLVTHGGPFRVLFRDVLKKGELGNPIGDCAWIELEKVGEEFAVKDSSGVEFI